MKGMDFVHPFPFVGKEENNNDFFQPRLASPIFDGIGRLSNQAQDDWKHPV
jgi:hypothetical protein